MSVFVYIQVTHTYIHICTDLFRLKSKALFTRNRLKPWVENRTVSGYISIRGAKIRIHVFPCPLWSVSAWCDEWENWLEKRLGVFLDGCTNFACSFPLGEGAISGGDEGTRSQGSFYVELSWELCDLLRVGRGVSLSSTWSSDGPGSLDSNFKNLTGALRSLKAKKSALLELDQKKAGHWLVCHWVLCMPLQLCRPMWNHHTRLSLCSYGTLTSSHKWGSKAKWFNSPTSNEFGPHWGVVSAVHRKMGWCPPDEGGLVSAHSSAFLNWCQCRWATDHSLNGKGSHGHVLRGLAKVCSPLVQKWYWFP